LAVIHCDLPLLTCRELDRFLTVHSGGEPNAVTIAPDRWRRGTNLLAWSPLAEFSAQYGTNSFRRHCELARQCGASVQVCELPGAGLDIDEPDDLRAFALDKRLDRAPETRCYLSDSGLLERISSPSPCTIEVS
jgi:2-phospho-L-lactate/phosphoenolpyruvate guanylyltransferase